ncbi:MAG: hypothetical protein ACRD4O_11555 [Bryobacteraceae bacterium]
MLRVLLAMCLAACLRAEIVDRVAIYSGTQVITELQLDEDMRVTAFLNRKSVARGVDARRATARRLVDRMLVEREMQLSRYPLPGAADIDRYFEQVKKLFGTEPAFEKALAKYDLTDAVLRAHLALQLTMLRFIDYRFRPEAAISSAEISSYYRANLRAWTAARGDAPPPSLSASREAIRETLIEQRAGKALNAWLAENRKQMRLVYLDRTLE